MAERALSLTGHNLADLVSHTRKARARCPHCKCAANCRSSREITITHRESYYVCTNLFCGFAWHASESFDYGLCPSAIPDPKVDLPMRVPARQDVMELLRQTNAGQATPDQPELFDGAAPPELPG